MIDSEEQRPDLYIGLVCAAGTDLTETRNQLQAQLSVVGYRCIHIKVSDIISELLELQVPSDEYERMKYLMGAGDSIREASDGGQGVAAAIVAEIRNRRDSDDAPTTTAFILDSLKNPAEVELLDRVYGRNYYTISIYLPKDVRIENLKNKIAKGRHEPPGEGHLELSKDLVREDEKGIGKKCQNVQDTFPKADFFVNGVEDVSGQSERFVKIIFGEPFITPTNDEYHMFVAKAAALRSCDLSRQVGAVIVDKNKSIVATGCNEVPYPGGGIFFEGRVGSIGDNRDHTKGSDPNYIEIQRSLIEIIDVLKSTGHIESDDSASVISDALLHGSYKELMSNARVRNLIEFGRVVHAEMHAITQAASVGRSVSESTLYCTTFPCHGCARHIISSGISDVVFIEPYPKSLTAKLYRDEIVMIHREGDSEDGDRVAGKVRFRPFHGVAPTLYQRVFSYRPRKDQYGTIAAWKPRKATPVGAAFGVDRPKLELAASNSLVDILKNIKVLTSAESREAGDAEEHSNRPDKKRSAIFQRFFGK